MESRTEQQEDEISMLCNKLLGYKIGEYVEKFHDALEGEMEGCCVNIPLFGMTGSGKSALINTIFQSLDLESQPAVIQSAGKEGTKILESYALPGRQITLYDTRGFFELDTKEEGNVFLFMNFFYDFLHVLIQDIRWIKGNLIEYNAICICFPSSLGKLYIYIRYVSQIRNLIPPLTKITPWPVLKPDEKIEKQNILKLGHKRNVIKTLKNDQYLNQNLTGAGSGELEEWGERDEYPRRYMEDIHGDAKIWILFSSGKTEQYFRNERSEWVKY